LSDEKTLQRSAAAEYNSYLSDEKALQRQSAALEQQGNPDIAEACARSTADCNSVARQWQARYLEIERQMAARAVQFQAASRATSAKMAARAEQFQAASRAISTEISARGKSGLEFPNAAPITAPQPFQQPKFGDVLQTANDAFNNVPGLPQGLQFTSKNTEKIAHDLGADWTERSDGGVRQVVGVLGGAAVGAAAGVATRSLTAAGRTALAAQARQLTQPLARASPSSGWIATPLSSSRGQGFAATARRGSQSLRGGGVARLAENPFTPRTPVASESPVQPPSVQQGAVTALGTRAFAGRQVLANAHSKLRKVVAGLQAVSKQRIALLKNTWEREFYGSVRNHKYTGKMAQPSAGGCGQFACASAAEHFKPYEHFSVPKQFNARVQQLADQLNRFATSPQEVVTLFKSQHIFATAKRAVPVARLVKALSIKNALPVVVGIGPTGGKRGHWIELTGITRNHLGDVTGFRVNDPAGDALLGSSTYEVPLQTFSKFFTQNGGDVVFPIGLMQ
ncbi:MAG: hypothetical protein ACREU3_11185, partial [Steroidobacteraceae bacterium]